MVASSLVVASLLQRCSSTARTTSLPAGQSPPDATAPFLLLAHKGRLAACHCKCLTVVQSAGSSQSVSQSVSRPVAVRQTSPPPQASICRAIIASVENCKYNEVPWSTTLLAGCFVFSCLSKFKRLPAFFTTPRPREDE